MARTIVGDAVMTRYGEAQVQISLDAQGKIVAVTPLKLPSGGKPAFSRYAEPILRVEVLQAQSAQVDLVSGATYTSNGYLQSLQSALDQL